MKLLCVEPGPAFSTIDVFNGVVKGLRQVGHQVGTFALHNRIHHANQCLFARWKEAGSDPAMEPEANEVIFHASGEIVQLALLHEVDWVVFISCGLVHPAIFKMLKRAGVPTALLLTESPYEEKRQLEFVALADIVWTNERTSVDGLRLTNQQTFYLPHAYDPEIHHTRDVDPSIARHDVVFVGTLWQERIDLLSSVDWSGIDLGIYGSADLFDFEKFPDRGNQEKFETLRQYMHVGLIQNERTASLYAAAQIGLNLHRTSIDLNSGRHILSAESMNPRCYEQAATGGALLLTDDRAEVREVFGRAVPTFSDARSLSDQIRHLLNSPEEVELRVHRLQELVAPHTIEARAEQITWDLMSASYVFTRSEAW